MREQISILIDLRIILRDVRSRDVNLFTDMNSIFKDRRIILKDMTSILETGLRDMRNHFTTGIHEIHQTFVCL